MDLARKSMSAHADSLFDKNLPALNMILSMLQPKTKEQCYIIFMEDLNNGNVKGSLTLIIIAY